MLYSFVFRYFLYIVFYDVILFYVCSIVLRVRNKGDDDDHDDDG